jgi:aspartate kinase
MKFGGTSVEDWPAFERVARVVRAHESARPLVVVVSAMGGVTDALLDALRSAEGGELSLAQNLVEAHLERHLRVADQLGAKARAGVRTTVESARREIAGLLGAVGGNGTSRARLRDAVASYGESLSAALLAAVLLEHGLPATYVDARRCILTDASHGRARPIYAETRRRTRAEIGPLLTAGRIPVLGGFIAATAEGVTTTLGRGSSDYTATLVGAALSARETQIWTDVSGVLTADPRLIETARTVPRLSYDEAAELARFGAQVLHPKTIGPAAALGIPLRIRNSRAPQDVGTIIRAGRVASRGAIKAIACRTGFATAEFTPARGFPADGFARVVREVSGRNQSAVHLMATAGDRFVVACEEAGALPSILQDLRAFGPIEFRSERAIVCCVGEGLQYARGRALESRDALRGLDSTLDWCSTSSYNFVSILDGDRVGAVVRRLHHAIFENHKAQEEAASFSG